MSKIWYTFRLGNGVYDTGIVATQCHFMHRKRVAFLHLPEAVWILIPLPIIDGATFSSGKPVFALPCRTTREAVTSIH